jgi:hypothetical protein
MNGGEGEHIADPRLAEGQGEPPASTRSTSLSLSCSSQSSGRSGRSLFVCQQSQPSSMDANRPEKSHQPFEIVRPKGSA